MIEKLMKILTEAMKLDPSYAWGWQCNLAMAIYDQGLSHIEANIAAANFMKNAFDIDVTQYKEYKDIISSDDSYPTCICATEVAESNYLEQCKELQESYRISIINLLKQHNLVLDTVNKEYTNLQTGDKVLVLFMATDKTRGRYLENCIVYSKNGRIFTMYEKEFYQKFKE